MHMHTSLSMDRITSGQCVFVCSRAQLAPSFIGEHTHTHKRGKRDMDSKFNLETNFWCQSKESIMLWCVLFMRTSEADKRNLRTQLSSRGAGASSFVFRIALSWCTFDYFMLMLLMLASMLSSMACIFYLCPLISD